MHSPSTHVSLLERLAAGGDQEAWSLFCERYGPLVRDYGRRRGLQPSDCDDLLQTVLLSLSKSVRNFTYDSEKGRLRSYLKTVAIRSISKIGCQSPAAGAQVALSDTLEADDDDEEAWERAWRQHHVRRALAQAEREVAERTMSAFSLFVLEGRSARETAELLGTTTEVVYQAKSRLLKRLSELVAEQVDEEG